jgi:hypothetical protein
MGKLKFNNGEKVINRREPDKSGVIVGYHRETREYQIRLADGRIHYESPRWLDAESATRNQ